MPLLKYKEITKKILAASFEVHNFLGLGFQEVIYQRALAWEFGEHDLEYQREVAQDIYYKNIPNPIGTRRADFVVERKVIIELKALKELESAPINQTLNYLKIYKFEVGLLINFGRKSLEFKRFVL